jgi:hypothetical protein
VKYDNDKNLWYPCVKISEKGNTVIFNPFASKNSVGASIINPFNILAV